MLEDALVVENDRIVIKMRVILTDRAACGDYIFTLLPIFRGAAIGKMAIFRARTRCGGKTWGSARFFVNDNRSQHDTLT
jgi:hypothetical protein